MKGIKRQKAFSKGMKQNNGFSKGLKQQGQTYPMMGGNVNMAHVPDEYELRRQEKRIRLGD